MATVLIVDDENAIGELLSEIIEDTGHRAIATTSGQEALNALRTLATPPSLVLSDAMMPTMNGQELAAAIRAMPEYAEVPFILMSAATQTYNQAHIDAFVAKPFDMDTLLSVIMRYLP